MAHLFYDVIYRYCDKKIGQVYLAYIAILKKRDITHMNMIILGEKELERHLTKRPASLTAHLLHVLKVFV